MRKLALPDEVLLSIDHPARYIGGEVNMCVKDPKEVDVRFAMCFPDVYSLIRLGLFPLDGFGSDYEERTDSPVCIRIPGSH